MTSDEQREPQQAQQALLYHPDPYAPNVVAEFRRFLRTVTPRAWVTPAILVANVAVFGAMVASGVGPLSPTVDQLVAWGAGFGPRTLGAEPWRLLTSTFVHIGFLHLVMNMLALWDAGRVVELLFGQARFAAVYVAAGLGGSVASVALHPQICSAGASGAVFGVYGALGAFLLLQRGGVPPPVLSKLSRVAFWFIGYNVIYGFTRPGIDVAAHFGGLAAGVAAGAWLSRPLNAGRLEELGAPARVAAVAVAIAATAIVLLPRPADLVAALNRFNADEMRIVARYQALLTEAQQGKMSNVGFADAVQEEVIRPWRDAQVGLAAPKGLEDRQQRLLDLVKSYATAREDVWTSIVAGARSGLGEARIEEIKAHDAEVERLRKELEKFAKAG